MREKYLGNANALERQRGSLAGVIDHGLVQVLRVVAQPWRPIVMTDKALSQAATQHAGRKEGEWPHVATAQQGGGAEFSHRRDLTWGRAASGGWGGW